MVKKRLVSSFDNILRGKIYYFMKKSIWRYLLASLILGYLTPINEINSIGSALIYFTGINIILWPLQYLSAKAQEKTFDALVEFDEREIKINHNNQDLIEIKDWSWIKKIEMNQDRIWLTINQSKPFGVSIPKSKLTTSEIDFFNLMKKKKNDR